MEYEKYYNYNFAVSNLMAGVTYDF
jgi:hypothetical protein